MYQNARLKSSSAWTCFMHIWMKINTKEADRVLTEIETIVGTTDPDIAAARTSLDLERILGE